MRRSSSRLQAYRPSRLQRRAHLWVHAERNDRGPSELLTEFVILRTSLSYSGLFLPWEARLIQAAEVSGKLADSYNGLARRYVNRARRYGNLKRGMTLPLALFVLAVLVAPLPALLLGAIGIDRYLLNTTGRLLLFFGSLYLLSWSWRQLGATGADNALFRLLLRTPLLGSLIRRQQQYNYLSSLALLMDAGVPAFDASLVFYMFLVKSYLDDVLRAFA